VEEQLFLKYNRDFWDIGTVEKAINVAKTEKNDSSSASDEVEVTKSAPKKQKTLHQVLNAANNNPVATNNNSNAIAEQSKKNNKKKSSKTKDKKK